VEHAPSWAIIRTSWVFGKQDSDIVNWAFKEYERGELRGVLADQMSIHTYAPDLADLVARFAIERRTGLFHVTSGSEAATRYDFVVTALRERGLDVSGIQPISATAIDRPARRPAFSALDNRALRLSGVPGLRAWRDALAEYVKEWT
jgi:dTDP-4-dehydrorhamnose reductase